MFFAGIAAAAFHGRTAFVTLGKMFIALGIGAIDHFIGCFPAIEACRD